MEQPSRGVVVFTNVLKLNPVERKIKMKLHDIGEVNDFLEVVNRCKGQVWLESAEGDRFNLKSSLSQYVAIGKLITDKTDELNLFCSDRSDESKFFVLFSEHPRIM